MCAWSLPDLPLFLSLCPSAPASSIQYRASNLDWQLFSYMFFSCFYADGSQTLVPWTAQHQHHTGHVNSPKPSSDVQPQPLRVCLPTVPPRWSPVLPATLTCPAWPSRWAEFPWVLNPRHETVQNSLHLQTGVGGKCWEPGGRRESPRHGSVE